MRPKKYEKREEAGEEWFEGENDQRVLDLNSLELERDLDDEQIGLGAMKGGQGCERE